MDNTWVDEAWLDLWKWEEERGIDPNCHDPYFMEVAKNTQYSYYYADAYWKVLPLGTIDWQLYPILH